MKDPNRIIDISSKVTPKASAQGVVKQMKLQFKILESSSPQVLENLLDEFCIGRSIVNVAYSTRSSIGDYDSQYSALVSYVQ